MIKEDYKQDLTQRYFKFSICDYESEGGLNDVVSTCDTLEEAKEMYKDSIGLDFLECYVWDNKTRTIVFGNKTR
jgi:hypothetical protein